MSCNVCGTELMSDRAKTCRDKKCVSAWKMARNARLPPVFKKCSACGVVFSTVDRRNNFCSSECKTRHSVKVKLQKYGTLSLESRESIRRRTDKLKKHKTKCKDSQCELFARTKGWCASHYVKNVYLATESGKETYRLHNQKRRHSDARVILKCELQWLRSVQTECQKCGNAGPLTLDHHVPLSAGGRLSLCNTVLLCGSCNSKKHDAPPAEFYSAEELQKIDSHFDSVRAVKAQLPVVYFLFGCFGAGKTWVASQLRDKFFVVEYDKLRTNSIEVMTAYTGDKPILYVSSIGITPFMNRHGMQFNFVPIALVEDLETIRQRITQRGGHPSAGLARRIDRVRSISKKYAAFSGNSTEVLEFLTSL